MATTLHGRPYADFIVEREQPEPGSLDDGWVGV